MIKDNSRVTGEKIVIFQAVSVYQLLELIVYKERYLREKECVLLIPSWLKDKISSWNILTEEFNKVLILYLGFDYESPDIEKKIIDIYDHFFEDNKISVYDCSEIHIAGAHYGIGAYLCLKNISFYFWEDASGVIDNPEFLRGIEIQISAAREQFNDKLGLFDGNNSNIEKIYANLSDISDVTNSNLRIFNVIDEMSGLNTEALNRIMQIFTEERIIDVQKDSVLLLTEHFANCQRLTFEEQILIYQLYKDYFFENQKLVIKPHPDDLMYYDQIFKDAQIIKGKYPSEFLPYIFTNKPDILATISSAAIKTLKYSFEKVFDLDTLFEKRFKSIHRYYIALAVCLHFCKYEEIERKGIYNCLIDRLYEQNCFSETQKKQNIRVKLVDDFEDLELKNNIFGQRDSVNEKTVIIFLNSLDEYHFYDNVGDSNIWEDIYPLTIKKEMLSYVQEDFMQI